MSQLKRGISWRFKLLVIGVSSYIAGVLIWDIIGAGKVWRQLEQARGKVEALKTEQVQLEQQLALVNSDEFREEQIRDQLLLAKPGETVVVIPQVAQVAQVARVVEEKELPNWQKWAKLFW